MKPIGARAHAKLVLKLPPSFRMATDSLQYRKFPGGSCPLSFDSVFVILFVSMSAVLKD